MDSSNNSNSEIITIYTIADLWDWIESDLSRFGNVRDTVLIKEETPNLLRFSIFTDINEYSISAHNTNQDSKSYLGCISNCRKPRAGEDWHRGSDLADGKLTPEIWHRILADIVSYEKVKIHRQKSIKGMGISSDN